MSDYRYYKGELNKLLPLSKYPVTMHFTHDGKQSNHIDLNKDSLKAINNFFKTYIKENQK